MRPTRLILLFLLFLCLPAQAAEPVFERFIGPSPAMFIAERTGKPAQATEFAGGWGYTPDDACRILVPEGASAAKTLLTAYAVNEQQLIGFLRLSLECERIGLVPARITPLSRTIQLGPQDSIYEFLEVELLAVPKERAADLEALNADASLSAEERLRRLTEMSVRAVREFWFDTTDIRNHNAGVLYNATYKPRAVSSHGVSAGRLVKAPELLQRSIYLEITPQGYLTAVPGANIDPALVDGGWGYDRDSALVQRLPKGEIAQYQDFIRLQMNLAFLRTQLEFAQSTPALERLQLVDLEKRRQELVTPDNGRAYDRLTLDIYLVSADDYDKAAPLMRENTPEAKKTLRDMAYKVEREFWFDITEPFAHNAKILEGK